MPTYRLGTAPDPPAIYRIGVAADWVTFRFGVVVSPATFRLGVTSAVTFRLGVAFPQALFRLGIVRSATFRLGITSPTLTFRLGVSPGSVTFRLGVFDRLLNAGTIRIIQQQPCHTGTILYEPDVDGTYEIVFETWNGSKLLALPLGSNSWSYQLDRDQVVRVRIYRDGEEVAEQYFPLDCTAQYVIGVLRKEYITPDCDCCQHYELISAMHLGAMQAHRSAKYALCERMLTWIGSFLATYRYD